MKNANRYENNSYTAQKETDTPKKKKTTITMTALPTDENEIKFCLRNKFWQSNLFAFKEITKEL